MNSSVKKKRVLERLENAWTTLEASYAGLDDRRMIEPGVTGEWSVKDILAHVAAWQDEALKYLPVIAEGKRPPRYSVMYGGIHAFNERVTVEKKGLSLEKVLNQLHATHRRVVEMVSATPESLLDTESRYVRRLRADTYGHYTKHAKAIQLWRTRS